MKIIQTWRASYHHTLRIGRGAVEVKVEIDGDVLYDGPATNVVDTNGILSFEDSKGEPHSYQRPQESTATE